MAPKVEPATLEDASAIIDVFFACFDDEYFTTLFPRDAAGRQYLIDAWKGFMRSGEEGSQEGRVFVSRNDQGDVVSANLIWIVKPEDGGVWSWRRRWFAPPDGSERGKMLDEFFHGMHAQHEKVMGEREHIYFELLITHPSHQKQGHGAAFLRHATRLAEQLGYALYLDAEKEFIPLYEKHGYVARTDVEATSPMQAMVREVPRA